MLQLDKEFNCSFCSKVHVIPNESFPTCVLISKLLSIKSNEVFRGDNVNSLKSNLNDIQKAINELSFGVDNGVDYIKEHCLNLRAEVQLVTETVINEVNEMSEKMINQINIYEQERIKKYNESKENKVDFFKFVGNLKKLFNWIY